MNQLKFRAWDHFNERFIYSYKFASLGRFFIEVDMLEDGGNKVTVEQCTGEVDGVEAPIFKDDILHCAHKDQPAVSVVWSLDHSAWGLSDGSLFLDQSMEDFVVIGNSHQSPEVLAAN